jgi:hypothetical protein
VLDLHPTRELRLTIAARDLSLGRPGRAAFRTATLGTATLGTATLGPAPPLATLRLAAALLLGAAVPAATAATTAASPGGRALLATVGTVAGAVAA